MTEGRTPVIITVPHAGNRVPEHLYQGDRPLGLPPRFFDNKSPYRRHETCDWGMSRVVQYVLDHGWDVTIVTTNVSRLVCDVNRAPDDNGFITKHSNDTGSPLHTKYAGQFNANLSDNETATRVAYYKEYHNGLASQIQRVKDLHGFAIILDLHSFAPKFSGKPRTVEVGTLELPDPTGLSSEITKALTREYRTTNTLKRRFKHERPAYVNFASKAPYDLGRLPQKEIAFVRNMETDAGAYVGLEFRSDVLKTRAGIAKVMVPIQKALEPCIGGHVQHQDFKETALMNLLEQTKLASRYIEKARRKADAMA